MLVTWWNRTQLSQAMKLSYQLLSREILPTAPYGFNTSTKLHADIIGSKANAIEEVEHSLGGNQSYGRGFTTHVAHDLQSFRQDYWSAWTDSQGVSC
jgi:hypothetical protein